MEHEPALIVEVAQGSALERSLRQGRAGGGEPGEIVILGLAPETPGRLPAPPSGQVVLSVPSPEALTRDPEAVRRVVDQAAAGAEPLVITVEEAEALREEELRPVLDAATGARRPVILRVMNAA